MGIRNFVPIVLRKGADVCGVDIITSNMIAKADDNTKKANLEMLVLHMQSLKSLLKRNFAQGNFDCAVLNPGRGGTIQVSFWRVEKS